MVLALASGPTAWAGGLGYPGPGSRALGRGGAFAVRADDGMALEYNPAQIGASGRWQLLVNSHFAFYGACVQRHGTYTDNVAIRDVSRFGDSELAPGEGGYAREAYPTVCNAGVPIPEPGVVFSAAVTPRIGIAFGFLVPFATGSVRFGDDSGTVVGVNGELRPNPLRYMTLASSGFALSPSIGASWQAAPWLRLGTTVQWGIASLNVLSYGVTTGGENPSIDGRAEVTGSDLWIPAVIAGLHVTLIPGLELAFAFRWSDDLRGTATIDMRFGDFGSAEPGSTIPTDSKLTDVRMRFPLPWQLTFGVRYAARRTAGNDDRDGGAPYDPLTQDRWDIELDIVYELNDRVREVVMVPRDDATLTVRERLPDGTLSTLEVPVDSPFRVPRRWQNQLSIRVGGDYVVLPGLLALRAGLSIETRGIDPAFANVDFLPVRRLGLHLGCTMRLTEKIDLTAAYAHLFQETLDVRPAAEAGGARLRQMAADNTGRVINAGTYRTGWNIASIGATYRF